MSLETITIPAARIRGIRGATSVAENTKTAIDGAVFELLSTLINDNQIDVSAIVSVFFTVTPDVTKISPAKVARTRLDWELLPMVCSAEPFIEGLPERCIRVLIQLYTTQPPEAIHHAYLNDAAVLRPDRAS